MSTLRLSNYTLERGGALQRKTLWVLVAGTILGGLGVGAALSVGALLLAEVSGDEAISGLASATFSAGAAIAGIPLARIAAKHGRRRAIVTGNLIAGAGAAVAIFSTVLGLWWMLAVGLALVGVASAVQLLSRFTATDLAKPTQRARDLSLVVWSITIGAVVGPNLMGPGGIVGEALGLTPLAGVFVFAFFAQMIAAAISFTFLNPDPLLTARLLPPETGQTSASGSAPTATTKRSEQFTIIGIIAIAQAIMVGLMAMTPLHLTHHGGSHELVGATLSLHIAGMYALSPIFGFLASRFGRFLVINLGWAILLVSAFLAFYSGPSHLVTIIALTLLGVGWSAVTVAGATLITELTPAIDRTRRQGQSDTFMSAAGAVTGALAGVGFAFAGFEMLALVAAGLVVVGLFLVIWVTWVLKRESQNQTS